DHSGKTESNVNALVSQAEEDGLFAAGTERGSADGEIRRRSRKGSAEASPKKSEPEEGKVATQQSSNRIVTAKPTEPGTTHVPKESEKEQSCISSCDAEILLQPQR